MAVTAIWPLKGRIDGVINYARNPEKTDEEYILSSKLLCGHCETYMCGESGTSANGTVHHYYKCMAVKKKIKPCNKKTIRKDWIEDIVINEIVKIIFDDNTIESIISMVMKLQSEENKEIPLR